MSYKLTEEQRERANALIEQIIDDPEAAAFEIIWLRENQRHSEQAMELNRTEGLCPRCWDADGEMVPCDPVGDSDVQECRDGCGYRSNAVVLPPAAQPETPQDHE